MSVNTPPPDEDEEEKKMRQMMAQMRGGIIPSLSENASDEEACVLSEEILDRRDHGVEMMLNLAKMRQAQHSPEAFLALARGEQDEVDLDTLVSKFGAGAVKTDAEYCTHCAKTIWHDVDDNVWRHVDGENTACNFGGDVHAEPVRDDDEVSSDGIDLQKASTQFAALLKQIKPSP